MSLQKVKKHPKMASLPLFWHRGSSLGRIKIWRGKWAPNSKIPVEIESRQDTLSNKSTWAHFWHLKVPQNRPQSSAAHRGKIAKFSSVSQNFGSRLLQVGPLIYTSVFWHQRQHVKCFFLQIGSYPSGEGRQTVTQDKCHVCSVALVADGWLSISILQWFE